MKPVGLTDPRTGVRPHAVVQLRQENALGTPFNMVGFQTKLTYGEQKRIFRMIPGLERAEFARLGGMHRNTFIDARACSTRAAPAARGRNVRFAGQITGVEGYVESAAIGLLAGRFAAARGSGPQRPRRRPRRPRSARSSRHITGGASAATFQPMNVNFGLLPPLEPAGQARRAQAGAGAPRAGRSRRLARQRWRRRRDGRAGGAPERRRQHPELRRPAPAFPPWSSNPVARRSRSYRTGRCRSTSVRPACRSCRCRRSSRPPLGTNDVAPAHPDRRDRHAHNGSGLRSSQLRDHPFHRFARRPNAVHRHLQHRRGRRRAHRDLAARDAGGAELRGGARAAVPN